MKLKILKIKYETFGIKSSRLIFIFSGVACLAFGRPIPTYPQTVYVNPQHHSPTEVRGKISLEDMKHNKGILIALWIRWDKLRSVNIPLMSYSYP